MIDIKLINAFHIFVIGALFVYMGILGNITPVELYYVTFGLSLVIFAIMRPPNFKDFSYWNIIKWTHYIVIVPGIIYLSYAGVNDTLTPIEFEVLRYLGIGIILYHAYKLGSRVF